MNTEQEHDCLDGSRTKNLNDLGPAMKISRRTLMTSAALASVLPQAFAQGAAAFPQRAVKIVVPGPVGGPLDVVARIVGQRFSETTGQPFVVEPRAGAAGSIGAKVVAQAAPNGYTLMITHPAPLVVNPYLHANAGYTKDDFSSIGQICSGPFILVVRADSPIKTIDDLVSLGKKPKAGFYASNGNGTMAHVCGAILTTAEGLSYGHIPYTGGPAAAQALLAGDVSWVFMDLGNANPLLADKRVRALAVTTRNRSDLAPTVPSMADLGFKQFDLAVWYGLVAPAKTPQPVIQQMSTLLAQALKDPGIQATIRRLGFEPATNTTPAHLDRLQETEAGTYQRIIQTAHMKVE